MNAQGSGTPAFVVLRRCEGDPGRTFVIIMDAVADDFEPSEIHALVQDGPARDQ